MLGAGKTDSHEFHDSNETEPWDDLIQRCWRHEECWECLRQKPCNWCPSSGLCIPNTSKLSILAPIFNPDVCPYWAERWELRARPLGCNVSTITLLTCVITVLSTFVVIGAVATAVKGTRWIVGRWKARESGWWKVWKYYQPGWWKAWRLELIDIEPRRQPERTPLLA